MTFPTSLISLWLHPVSQTSADRLLERLRDPDLQIAIDESGKTKTKTSFSWDAIINAVFIYVGTEVEKSKASPHLNDDTIARKMQVTNLCHHF